MRHDALDANDWFANANGLPKPPLRQQDFGGVIGGPVWLPGPGRDGGLSGYDGRDRTFFFFSYEGLRLRLPQARLAIVSSLAARAAAPPHIKPLMDALPLPTGPDLGNGLAELAISYADRSTLDATSLRLDHTVNGSLTLFGRYNYTPSEERERSPNVSYFGVVPVTTRMLTLGATQRLGSSMSHEARVSYATNTGAVLNESDGFGGAIPPDNTLLLPPFADPANSLSGFFLTSESVGWATGKNSFNRQRQINIVDNLSLLTGAHQLKFGVDYRHLAPSFDPPAYFTQIVFADVASLLEGRASYVTIAAIKPGRLSLHNLSLYAQDTWNVAPRLTLTYGLRWELDPAPSFDGEPKPLALTPVDDLESVTLAPQGTPIYETGYTNFAPRVGAAYQLHQARGWETVLRGGFGLFYDLTIGTASNTIVRYPYRTDKRVNNVRFPLTPAEAEPIPFPTLPFALPLESAITANDPRMNMPRTWQWNATLEQSLGARQALTVAYVGAAGRELLRLERAAETTNFPAGLVLRRGGGSSDYHALQAQFNRRLSRGIQALVSYTWAHSMDTASGENFTFTPSERIDARTDRAPSDFDVRHAVSGAVTYEIPAPAVGRLGTALLRNWSVDTIARAQTGTPINVEYARDIGFGSVYLRPDLVPGVPLYLDDPALAGGRRFNPAAFVVPVEPRQGTLGRNRLRGLPMWQVDLSLRRRIALTGRVSLQVKVDAFNLFNHPNFGDPSGRLTSALFGRSTQMLGRSLGAGGSDAGFSSLYQIGGPRSLQLALKLAF